jgi:hypothetical protein
MKAHGKYSCLSFNEHLADHSVLNH